MCFPIEIELEHTDRRNCFQGNVNLIVTQESPAIHMTFYQKNVPRNAATHRNTHIRITNEHWTSSEPSQATENGEKTTTVRKHVRRNPEWSGAYDLIASEAILNPRYPAVTVLIGYLSMQDSAKVCHVIWAWTFHTELRSSRSVVYNGTTWLFSNRKHK